jgi:hypothetical protein
MPYIVNKNILFSERKFGINGATPKTKLCGFGP